MISIAWIALPESAVWENEMQHGKPLNGHTECTDGYTLIHRGGADRNIVIYIPKVSGELTRQTVIQLKALMVQNSDISININGQVMTAVFHPENPIDLKPISAKHIYEDTDSYYGYIRLLEV